MVDLRVYRWLIEVVVGGWMRFLLWVVMELLVLLLRMRLLMLMLSPL